MEDNEARAVPSEDEAEELTTKYSGIRAMPFILGNETFEKVGSIGTGSNLAVYLTTVFNMRRVAAATLINVFHGTANIATLLGAYVSDTYLGRYKTLGCASVSSLLGMLVITLTAAFSNLRPPKCTAQDGAGCVQPTAMQFAFLLSGFGFLIIGAGGIRPCNLAFGADQFNPATESGKRGINSFFNWYYCTVALGVMMSTTLIVYVQSSVSWTIGFSIPASLMLLSCVLLFAGTRIYNKVKPQGSPLASIAQVFVAAIKKRRLKLPNDPDLSLFNYVPPKSYNTRLAHTDQFRCLDKSTIITPEDRINLDGSAADSWRLCSVQQVEEVKCIVRVLPILASATIFSLANSQTHTYAVFQALQSNRRLGNSSFMIPAASYLVFIMLTVTIWVPMYDRILVPVLRRITGIEGGITVLQRMGVGLFLSALSMIVAGLVEERRRNAVPPEPMRGSTHRVGAISSMSGLWLIPQLALGGISEAFHMIAQAEFYYKQLPENMRSIAGSFTHTGAAFAGYLSGFLVSFVHSVTVRSSSGDWLREDLNKGKLNYFYYLIAGLGLLNFVYFLMCARWYRYKGESDKTVGSGRSQIV